MTTTISRGKSGHIFGSLKRKSDELSSRTPEQVNPSEMRRFLDATYRFGSKVDGAYQLLLIT